MTIHWSPFLLFGIPKTLEIGCTAYINYYITSGAC